MKPAPSIASESRDKRMGADVYPRAFGPYVLLKPLARGGMGALYLALTGERGMEKLCVIKTVLNHLADRSYVQRFRDEAKVVVRLSHGNLVAVFDAGQVAGEIFLAMDFIEGKDLRAVWNRCAQKGIAFPIDVAVHITKELVRGLGYAHSFGGLNLVHRDVSPPNVLLSYTGEVKLTDFGLASSTLKLEKTAPGVIYGKVSYMAPEQARGDALDGRADLYAAGIMLWELLTGRQLFPASTGLAGFGNNEDDLLERVRHPRMEPPSSKTRRVPPELDRIVLKALAGDPAERYQNGEAFRADLAAFQARTAPATDGEHVARFLRRLFGEDIDRESHARERLITDGARLLANTGTPPPPSASFLDDGQKTPSLGRAKGGGTRPMNAGDAGAVGSAPDTRNELRAQGRKGDTEAIGSPVMGTPLETTSQTIGAILGGRYQIVRLVGEGGMGRVYEAEHIEIGKRVAIKVLHPAYTRTPEVVERFRREARAASRIGHPNIVNVTDSGTTDDGSFFFVMEFIEGIELGLAVHREGPMSIKRTLRIADQMCQALQAAHDSGVIHRDLKPENVLLITKEGRPDFVKVLDFGIAKSAEVEEASAEGRRLTRPGVAMGTPEYMAPEQAAGRPADPRSDIYAVGSIIYEMLTGVPPYEGDNVMEVLHKKANEAPVALRQLRQDVPESVELLVERAMARNPDGRPQTMAALGAEIALVLQALVGRRTPTEVRTDIRLDQLGERRDERRDAEFLAGALEPGGNMGALALSRRAKIATAASLFVIVGLVVVKAALRAPAPPPPPVAAVNAAPRPAPAPAPAAVVAIPAPPNVEPAEPSPGEVDPDEPVAVVDPGQSEWTLAEGLGAEATADDDGDPETRKERTRGKARTQLAASRRLLDEGQRFMTMQKYDEARARFEKLVKVRPVRGEALLGLGQIAFQQKDYKKAVKHARAGAGAGAGAGAHVLMGDAFFKLEDYAAARRAFEAALKLDPNNSVARKNLEVVQRRLN